MRLLLTCFLSVFLTYAPAFAFMQMIGQHVTSGGESPTWILYEDFGGTTIPGGWTTTGGSPDYSTNEKVSFDLGDKAVCDVFSSISTAYLAFTVEFDAVDNSSGTRFLRLNDSSGTLLAHLQLASGDKIVYTHGTTATYAATDLVAATKYYAWASYTSAGAYSLRLGTTGTYSSATLELNKTDGTSTAGLAQLELGQLFNDTTGNVHFELIAVDDAAIGDI